MKTIILTIALASGVFAATATFADNDTNTNTVPVVSTNTIPTPPPGDQPPPAPPPPSDGTPQPPATPDQAAGDTSSAPLPVVDTNVVALVPPGERGLRMNFKNAPLEAVLKYMSAAAGFIIHPKVDLSGKVTVWSEQPLTSDEALALLEQILTDSNYTVLQDGKTLTIIRSSDAKTSDIKVRSSEDPDTVPKNSEIVTQIIPVHTLNAVQLVKDLQQLLPPDSTLTSDESANSLVMTGTQTSIHHLLEIVKALDTVTSSSAVICVFPLKYADAKSLATLITTLFPNANATQGGGNGFNFGRFRGGGGGGFNPFGGGGDTSNDESKGHTPTAKVAAVSDDHGNLLVVSVPDSLADTISNLVHEVDAPVDDATVMKVFHLKNADPTEMVDLLTSMYPDDTGSSDATSRQARFGFPFGGGFPGQQANSSSTPSDRAKKLARVTAVADRRTSSLVVTAGKDTMQDIITMVEDLDARNDRKVQAYTISLQNADPVDVQTIMQELFPSSANGRSPASSGTTTTPATPLSDRSKALLQQQNSSSSSSSFGGQTSSSGTGRGF